MADQLADEWLRVLYARRRREDKAIKLFRQLYPGGYPGWWVGPEYAEPAKVKARK